VTVHFQGARLRQLREARGMTQRELADLIAPMVDRKHNDGVIRAWEMGLRAPRVPDLRALSDVFWVSTDYLLDRTDSPDMVRLDANGRSVVIEAKSTVAAKDHDALVDQAASAAQQVADAMEATTARKPRKKRA